jgi:CheY-like chemotaxis protein
MDERRVLAIEYDWRLRKLIRANLEAVGLTVQEAVSGVHGLQVLRDSEPDLILVDLDMPGEDSLQLLDALQVRTQDRQVMIVVLAGEPPQRCLLDHGQVHGWLPKPFSASGLIQQVQQALSGVESKSPEGQDHSGI